MSSKAAVAAPGRLASGQLGVPTVMFFVLSAATPLTVVAGVVTNGWAVTGLAGIPIAFLAVGAVLMIFSIGYVAMARQVANAGAFYAYVARGLGRPAGVGASWVALAAYNSLQVGLYGAIGAAAVPVLRWVEIDLPWWTVALVACAVVGVLGQLHVDVNGKVLAVLLALEVAVILVYSVGSLTHPAGDVVTVETLDPASLFAPGVGALLSIAVLGFVGFEATVVFSEETRDPHRTVRIATYLSVALLGGVYALASWAMSVATGPDHIVDQSRALSTELIFRLAGSHLGMTIVHIGQALFLTSVIAAMIAFHNTSARYAYALGRERVLPAFLGRTSARTSAPKYGSLVQTVVGFLVIITFAVAGWDPLVHLFYWGGALGALGVLALIATTSVAIVVFFASNPRDEPVWRRVVAPTLAVLATGTVFGLALGNFDILLGVDPDSPWRWGLPAALGGLAIAGIAWGFVLRRIRPKVYATIGFGARSIAARSGVEGARP